ncbi:MAG: hypothetical protein F4Y80_09965 [Caldilineaceae bacterium SB0665_bin_21]|nr:hypothetical protein [Caldilineaceae bacterium SB0665_bin_21]MYC61466.1 hypothetical protein [Caldilineaceae bacterium SB0661_bin_34]
MKWVVNPYFSRADRDQIPSHSWQAVAFYFSGSRQGAFDHLCRGPATSQNASRDQASVTGIIETRTAP